MTGFAHQLTIASCQLLAQQYVLARQSAQQAHPPRGRGQAPPRPMSFFVTSVGIGKGGDLGGLAGADAHCPRSPRPSAAAIAPGAPT